MLRVFNFWSYFLGTTIDIKCTLGGQLSPGWVQSMKKLVWLIISNLSFSTYFLYKRRIQIQWQLSIHFLRLFGVFLRFSYFANLEIWSPIDSTNFMMNFGNSIGIYFRVKCNAFIWYSWWMYTSQRQLKATWIFYVHGTYSSRYNLQLLDRLQLSIKFG